MLLVTGGYGLIGSNLVKRIAQTGQKVILLDRNMNPESDFFKGCSQHITFVSGDITNSFFLADLFRQHQVTSIVHSAANLNGVYCKQHPTDAMRTNTGGTLNLLELARIYDVKNFIYISSGSVFGKQQTTDPIYESTLATPMNMYATTKKMSEELVHGYRVNYGMNAVNVRVSWVFGPTPELAEPRWNTGPIGYYTWKVLTQRKLIEPSGIDMMANFTFIDDVTDGIVCALKSEDTPEYLHFSSEQMYSTKELVDFLQQKSPDSQIEIGPGSEPFTLQAPIRGPLVSEYKEQIGFQPKADFKHSLETYFNWMQEELRKRVK